VFGSDPASDGFRPRGTNHRTRETPRWVRGAIKARAREEHYSGNCELDGIGFITGLTTLPPFINNRLDQRL